MNVSFGRIRIIKENPLKTPAQIYAENYAIRAFAPNEYKPFEYGSDVSTGLEYSLDEALEKKRNADVCIVHKKNGNLQIKLRKIVPGTESNPVYYVPSESYQNKLKIEVNPNLPLSRLTCIFRKFAQRCEYYLKNGNGKLNRRTEAQIRASLGISEVK